MGMPDDKNFVFENSVFGNSVFNYTKEQESEFLNTVIEDLKKESAKLKEVTEKER